MVKLIVSNFEEDDFFHGSRYFADLIKLLPGQQHGANVELKNKVFGANNQMHENAGVTPSIVGEAYMNFGTSGIFYVCFLLGFVLAMFYNMAITRPSFIWVSLYITIIFSFGANALSAGISVAINHIIWNWLWIFIVYFFYKVKIHWYKPGTSNMQTINA